MADWRDAPIVQGAGPAAAPSGWQAAPIVSAPTAPQGGAWDGFNIVMDPVNAFTSSAVKSIPIAGPALTSFGNNVDAAFGRLIGAQETSPEAVAQLRQQEQQNYPIASAAGTVAGTVVPMMAAGGLPGAGRVLGTTGGITSRILGGAGSAAVIGGADATMRGQKPDEAVHTALLDAAMGGAAPLVFKGIGAGWRSMTRQPIIASSSRTLARAMADDNINPAEVNAKLAELGPDAVVADLGPNLRSQAGALAALPGKGQKAIVDALTARNAARNSRIAAEVNDTLGPSPVPSRVDAGIQSEMDKYGASYGALFANSSRVDTTPLAENLEADIVNRRGDAQKALIQVRNMLNVRGTEELDPNPYTLFQTRQAIDGMVATEKNPKVIQALTDARHQVDSILAPSVPGLKEVDAGFEELARQRDGLSQGSRVLGSGPTAAPPAELSDMISAGVQPKGIGVGPSAETYRLAQGTRAEIERIVGTTTNDLTALKGALKGDGSWNRDRLAQLYGSEKTDKLLTLLEREKTYDDTYSTALRNSLTASRVASQREMSTDAGGIPLSASPTGLILHALTKGANAGLAFSKGNTNAKIAAGLMGNSLSPEDSVILAAIMKQRAKPGLLAPVAVPMLENRAFGQ